jgi:hypothetical protein
MRSMGASVVEIKWVAAEDRFQKLALHVLSGGLRQIDSVKEIALLGRQGRQTRGGLVLVRGEVTCRH